MSLKILFVPFSIILMLVLFIGYIKPDYDAFLLKQSTYNAAQEQLNQMEHRLGNINAISKDFASTASDTIDGKNEKEIFLDRYVPEEIDQNRIVDTFNYLAGQSGASLSSLSIEKPATVSAVVKEQEMSSQAVLLNGAGTANNNGIAPDGTVAFGATYPSPKMYEATISLSANYASFLNLLNHIYHMDRENEIKSFTLQKDAEKLDDKGKPVSSDLLMGSFVVSFMYYPGLTNTHIQNIEALPLFNTSTFDMSAFHSIKLKTESYALPVLTTGSFSARENPFVL